MSTFAVECVDAAPDRYAAGPTMVFRLRMTEQTGQRVHAMLLRCQLRMEPRKRAYDEEEARRLQDLFGEPARWGDTLQPMQLASVAVMVPGFSGSTEIGVPVPFTYDVDVAAARYLDGLQGGEVPVLLLFSGTVFLDAGSDAGSGFSVEQLPWRTEAQHRLPVTAWRAMMDQHFPGEAWIRVRRDTLHALQDLRSARGLTSWDDTLAALLPIPVAHADAP